MPFTFKLSKRLARIRRQGHVAPAVALAIATAFACEVPSKLTDPGTSAASRLVVSPKVLTLYQYQGADFIAVGFTSTGDTVDMAVSWSATSGSITDTSTNSGRHYGRYRAGSDTGKVKVVVKGNPGGAADTAVVTVTPAPLASVTVSPATASLLLGATQQLAATLTDANGNTLTGRSITWTTSNGAVAAVSSAGLVTGMAAGAATIAATSEGRSGTAAITVTASVTTPGTVTDLAVASVTDSGVTLSFTEVSDGAGRPASYQVRFAVAPLSWGSAAEVTRGSCASPLAGSAIGSTRTCTVLGLAAGTGYQFQLVAFRGTLNVDAVFGGLSNVVSGTTAASTAPVASVTVSPASVSLAVGATQQLVATLKDAAGNTLTGRSVTWTSNAPLVAPVSGTGVVNALAAGLATITATSEGRSGAAAVTVTASGSPTVDTVFAEDFESGTLSAWQDGVDPARHRVVTDPSFARSGSRYLEVTYPAGNDGGWLTRWFMPGYDSLFVSYWVRFPSTWQGGTKLIAFYGSRTDNQWSAMGQAGKCPTGTDFFAAMVVAEATGNPGPTRFYTYYPAMAREPDGVTCWGRFGDGTETYVPPLAMSAGQWHHVEFWVKLNTPDQADASQTFWLDGVQRGTWSGFSFRSSTILRLNSVQLTFSSGGVPQTQMLYVDQLVVTTTRP